mmetsp:Transcript_76923/g.195245  ORF Transcript_76923/g.195245 Transcript_76923/m.195245 type:complete len:106 (+) Transcript_76923:658-975(+)
MQGELEWQCRGPRALPPEAAARHVEPVVERRTSFDGLWPAPGDALARRCAQRRGAQRNSSGRGPFAQRRLAGFAEANDGLRAHRSPTGRVFALLGLAGRLGPPHV